MNDLKPIDGIGVIRLEHRNLATVLKCLEGEAERYATKGAVPDFELLESMFEYVDGFLNTQHHPKENLYLFAELRLRRPDLAGVLDKLESEHRSGAAVLARVRNATAELSNAGDAGAFRKAVARYCEFEFAHMRLEEEKIIPAAEESLTKADRAMMDRAFVENHHDPLFGASRSETFDRLFEFLRTRLDSPDPRPDKGEQE